jgi:hypothetical protein
MMSNINELFENKDLKYVSIVLLENRLDFV